MESRWKWQLGRRRLLMASGPAALAALLVVRGVEAQSLAPTPACDDEPTPPNPQGPFFTPESPQRQSLLEPGIEGQRMILTGLVLTTDCRPISGALLDFWHADADGAYDNQGYRLRGHQYADESGRFRLETIVPGLYRPRTRHIHVHAQPPGGTRLTTQLYFPDEPANQGDPLFHPDLLMQPDPETRGMGMRFDFVLATS